MSADLAVSRIESRSLWSVSIVVLVLMLVAGRGLVAFDYASKNCVVGCDPLDLQLFTVYHDTHMVINHVFPPADGLHTQVCCDCDTKCSTLIFWREKWYIVTYEHDKIVKETVFDVVHCRHVFTTVRGDGCLECSGKGECARCSSDPYSPNYDPDCDTEIDPCRENPNAPNCQPGV